MNLDDEIIFLNQNKIESGVISEILQTRTGIIYTVEYLDSEDEFCQVKIEKVFKSIQELFDDLSKEFFKKKEWEENAKLWV
jgi:hypothetical protein